jgi:hypothetical protein
LAEAAVEKAVAATSAMAAAAACIRFFMVSPFDPARWSIEAAPRFKNLDEI